MNLQAVIKGHAQHWVQETSQGVMKEGTKDRGLPRWLEDSATLKQIKLASNSALPLCGPGKKTTVPPASVLMPGWFWLLHVHAPPCGSGGGHRDKPVVAAAEEEWQPSAARSWLCFAPPSWYDVGPGCAVRSSARREDGVLGERRYAQGFVSHLSDSVMCSKADSQLAIFSTVPRLLLKTESSLVPLHSPY